MKNGPRRKKRVATKLKRYTHEEFKAELERRCSSYKNGTAIMVTAEESKLRIEQILKAHVQNSRELRIAYPYPLFPSTFALNHFLTGSSYHLRLA